MPDRNSNIDYELITKYLAEEASTGEVFVVEEWIKASEDNQHAFSRMKMVWEQSGRIIPHAKAPVDVDKGWQSFKNKTSDPQTFPESAPKPLGRSRNLLFYATRVAAVFFFGVILYFFYINNLKNNTGSEQTVQLATTDKVLSDTLPDGSVASLNTHSEIAFPNDFNKEIREVTLKGEAFFKVVPNPNKPFVINASGVRVEVLGTSFYVQAYDTSGQIVIGVEEGSVKVVVSSTEVILRSGDKINIDESTNNISVKEEFNPNDLYWKSRTLVFHNEKLSDIFRVLEDNFDIKVKPENPQILDCRLTAKFYGENIDEIIGIINTNFNLTSRNTDNHIIISGSGCNE